jgi:hypothetical protein
LANNATFYVDAHNLEMIRILPVSYNTRARDSVVVKALCCKPEGRWFKSR